MTNVSDESSSTKNRITPKRVVKDTYSKTPVVQARTSTSSGHIPDKSPDNSCSSVSLVLVLIFSSLLFYFGYSHDDT